jgi:biopolymer transport protein ExbD
MVRERFTARADRRRAGVTTGQNNGEERYRQLGDTSPDAVEAALRNVLLDVENQPVVIHADREVPFQSVVTVMDAAKKIGVAKLGVGVKQEVKTPPDKKKRDTISVQPR